MFNNMMILSNAIEYQNGNINSYIIQKAYCDKLCRKILRQQYKDWIGF